MLISTEPREVELVRRVAQPLRFDLRPSRPALLLLLLLLLFLLLLVLIAAFDSQSSGALLFERRDGRGRDRQCLILEPVSFDSDPRLRCEVEDFQVGLRNIDFAWHGVAISFE